MIGNALMDLVRPGPHLPGIGLPKSAKARQGSGSQPDEVTRLDRFEPTPPTNPGGSQAFGLRFRHLSIRREIAALRSSGPPVQADDTSSAVPGYQVQEERQTQLNLFYARTQTLSVGMESGTADHLQTTSRSVGRTFEVSISLEASFLHQFAGQSEALSTADKALFDQYLSTTDQMVGLSGEAAQGFFDMVSQALEETRSVVMNGLDGFLNQAGSSLGLEGDALNNFKSQVADQVAGFFVDLGKFVQESRTQLGPSHEAQAQLPVPDAPIPGDDTTIGAAGT